MQQYILISRRIYNSCLILSVFSNNVIAKDIIPYNAFRDFNVVRQTKDNSCGAAALATMLKYKFNISNANERNILSQMREPDKEASFLELQELSKKYNINAIGLSLTIEELLKIKQPVIAYVNTVFSKDHFVIINGIDKNVIFISDPAFGNYTLNISDFKRIWALKKNTKGDILYLYNDLNIPLEFINSIENKHRLFLKR